MSYMSLLFSNEKCYKDFLNKKTDIIYQDVIKDLGISCILTEIEKITPNFPEDFLRYPLYDYDTQSLRREIVQELYDSSDIFDNFERFATDLFVLRKHCENVNNINNDDARNHGFLCAFIEYSKDLKHLAEITKNVQSHGLQMMHQNAQDLFLEIEDGIYKKAQEIFNSVNDMLSFSIRFDLFNQTLKIEDKEYNPITEQLSELLGNLFDAKFDFVFSAVNNNQLSQLEELLLKVMKVRNPDVFEALELFFIENKLFNFNILTNIYDEILFFLGYIKFVKKYEKAGFKFSLLDKTQKKYSHMEYMIFLSR